MASSRSVAFHSGSHDRAFDLKKGTKEDIKASNSPVPFLRSGPSPSEWMRLVR